MRENGRDEFLPEVEQYYKQYIKATKNGQKVVAHEAIRELHVILAQAKFKIEETTGQSVNFLFSDEDETTDVLLDVDTKKAMNERSNNNISCERYRPLSYNLTEYKLDWGSICKEAQRRNKIERMSDPCYNADDIEKQSECINYIFGSQSNKN